MFRYLGEITLVPITITIEGNIFFEEFYMKMKTREGGDIQIRQAEVLEYEDMYKVKILRLYFNRLGLAST